jgi:hypothetical protein
VNGTFVNWSALIRQAEYSDYRDSGALQILENSSLIISAAALTFESTSSELTYTGLRIVSPISGAVLTVPDSSLVVPPGHGLVIEEVEYPIQSRTVNPVTVNLDEYKNRDARNIFLGVNTDGVLYFRPNLALS